MKRAMRAQPSEEATGAPSSRAIFRLASAVSLGACAASLSGRACKHKSSLMRATALEHPAQLKALCCFVQPWKRFLCRAPPRRSSAKCVLTPAESYKQAPLWNSQRLLRNS